MNLFKRAWWRLWAHPGKTALLTGLFTVICTLVLSGFLIQSAAARAAESAKRSVGVVATMQLDLNALIASGGGSENDGAQPGVIGPGGDLRRSLVDKICASSAVARCNYTAESVGRPGDGRKLYQPVPPPAGQDAEGTDFLKADGVRELSEVSAFRNGDAKLVAGSGITKDSKADEVVIEERLAKANKLKVGDTFTMKEGNFPPPGEKRDDTDIPYKVIGIYKSGTADSGSYVPAMMDPANQIYLTTDGVSRLDGRKVGKDGGVVKQATFTLNDPEQLGQLKKDAKAAGADPEIFPLSVNDKQYKTLVGPIDKTAGFATVTVWLVAVAGTVILALIIASALRERRKELGILLSLGERKPRLLGQHLVEVVACAVIAVGLAAACSQFVSQAVGDQLLAGEVSSAKQDAADDGPRQDLSNPMGAGAPPEQTPEVEPIDSMDIRTGPADLARVGATGLGIAALATLVPGARILRLNPRDILTKGD